MGAFGLPGGGLQIAGHKVPWPAIGALAGVAGVVLILRARAGGQQVAAIGAAPPQPAQSVGVLGQGQEAQLANLSQQLASLGQSLSTSPPASATPTVTLNNATTGLFSSPGSGSQVTWLPAGTQLLSGGAPVQGSTPYGATSGYWAQSSWWQPVTYLGQTYYAWAPFAPATPKQ